LLSIETSSESGRCAPVQRLLCLAEGPAEPASSGRCQQTDLIRKAWKDSGKVYGDRKLHDGCWIAARPVEMFYDPVCKHVRNGMLSPGQFERQQILKAEGV
jgi:hypothetical protein